MQSQGGTNGVLQKHVVPVCITANSLRSTSKTLNTKVTAIDPTCRSPQRGIQGASNRSVLVGTISLLCEDSTTLVA